MSNNGNSATINSTGVGNFLLVPDKHDLQTLKTVGKVPYRLIKVDPRQSSIYATYSYEYQFDCIQTGNLTPTQSLHLDFIIYRNYNIGRISSLRIRVGIIETGGSYSATPTIAPYLFDRLETTIGSDSGPTQIQYDDMVMKAFNVLSNERLTTLEGFNNLNMNTSFASPTAQAAGTEFYYEIPMIGNILESMNINHVSSDIVAKLVFWAPPSGIQEAAPSGSVGTLAYDCSNTKLIMHGRKYADSYFAATKLDREWATGPDKAIAVNFFSGYKFENQYTLTQNQQQDILLPSINGICLGGFFVIRSSTSNISGGRRLYTNLGGTGGSSITNELGGLIQVTNGQNVNIFSANGIYPRQMRTVIHAVAFPDANGPVLAQYEFGITQDAASLMVNGNADGAYTFTGNEKLSLTPGTTAQSFTTGSYTVTVMFYFSNTLFISDGGKLVISKKNV